MILGNGVDIIEVSRIESAIERWGDAFLNHVFTDDEIAYAKQHKFPFPHYAGRFAAKEAIFKAMGDATLAWKDVSIINDASGKPVCHFRKPNNKNILLSISHSRDYAVASAIVTAQS